MNFIKIDNNKEFLFRILLSISKNIPLEKINIDTETLYLQ